MTSAWVSWGSERAYARRMQRLQIVGGLALLALLAGCAPACPQLEGGAYATTFSEVAGTCGPQEGGVVTLGPGEVPVFGASSDCTGFLDVAEDGCHADFDRTCPGGLRFDGFSDTVDSRSAETTFTLVVGSGAAPDGCRSTYTVRAVLVR
jgi:hypothetical protein